MDRSGGGSAPRGSWRGASKRGSRPVRGKPTTARPKSSLGAFVALGDGAAATTRFEDSDDGEMKAPGSGLGLTTEGTGGLEVLGDDTDSRKRRFETSQSTNRFMELKPLREGERQQAIQQGLLPDPLKPRRLDQATDFIGTCEEMCPEFEREEREYQNNVDLLERYPGTNRIDPAKAVKIFHRPAAGNDQPLPSDVRPPRILIQTLDYLFHELLPAHPLSETHHFLRDRTRAVRQDFTMQNVRGAEAIECNERIARYHVLALGTLREQSTFSESQELEQLRKVLKSLNEFYDDARASSPPIPTPNEPEFRAYNILTHLRDPDIIWSTELLPHSVFHSPLFQTALQLHSLAQRSNLGRGERASPNAFSRFFKLLSSPSVPYLFGCILSTHFADIRRGALDTLRKAYVNQHSLFPARTLAKILGCDDEREVQELCTAVGLECRIENGRLVVELHKGAVLTSGVIPSRVFKRLVEAKRGSTPYGDVIDGTHSSTYSVSPIPPTPALSPSATFSQQNSSQLSRPVSYFPQQPPTSRPAHQIPAHPGISSTQPPGPSRPSPFSTPVFTPEATPPPRNIFSSLSPSFFDPAPPPPTSDLNPGAVSFAPSSAFGSAPSQTLPPPSYGYQPVASTSTTQPLPSFAPPPITFRVEPPPTIKAPSRRQSTNVPAVVAPPRRQSPSPVVISPTIRRISVPVPSPGVSGAVRKALAKRLVKALLDELMQQATKVPARRAAEQGLKDHWGRVLKEEARQRTRFIQVAVLGLVDDLVKTAVRRQVGEVVLSARNDARLLRRFFDKWRDATDEELERGAREQERSRRFEEVASEIGTGPAWGISRTQEDEDAGFGLDLKSLEVSLMAVDVGGANGDDLDRLMAQNVEKARRLRDNIWAPATFLDLVANHLAGTLHARPPSGSSRIQWSALLATRTQHEAIASWLACKFDVNDDRREAEMDTTFADVMVRWVVGKEVAPIEVAQTTGLLIFDCTADSDHLIADAESFWQEARGRLHALVGNLLDQTIFQLSLLVVACPTHPLDTSGERDLRTKISNELSLSSLRDLHASSIFLPRLDHDTEAQFDGHLETVLSTVSERPSKAVQSLLALSTVLLREFDKAIEQNLTSRAIKSSSEEELLRHFVSVLNTVVEECRSIAAPSKELLVLLPLPETSLTLRHTVERYIHHPVFGAQGFFPLVESALAERPPVSNLRLVRVLLDHLAHVVRSNAERSTTRQESLTMALTPALARLRVALLKPKGTINGKPMKKRKASESPASNSPVNGNKKVAFNGDVGGRDSLLALSNIMRDARGLLIPSNVL